METVVETEIWKSWHSWYEAYHQSYCHSLKSSSRIFPTLIISYTVKDQCGILL